MTSQNARPSSCAMIPETSGRQPIPRPYRVIRVTSRVQLLTATIDGSGGQPVGSRTVAFFEDQPRFGRENPVESLEFFENGVA